jgi:single-stranded DNA-binding protein
MTSRSSTPTFGVEVKKENRVLDTNELLTIEGQLTDALSLGQSDDGRDWVWLPVMSTWRSGERILFRCYAWDTLAVRAASAFSKDDWVLVTGRVRQQRFDDPHHKAHPVIVVDVTNIGPSMRHADVTVHPAEAGHRDSATTTPAAGSAQRPKGRSAEPAPAAAPQTTEREPGHPVAPPAARRKRGALTGIPVRAPRMRPRPR